MSIYNSAWDLHILRAVNFSPSVAFCSLFGIIKTYIGKAVKK